MLIEPLVLTFGMQFFLLCVASLAKNKFPFKFLKVLSTFKRMK